MLTNDDKHWLAQLESSKESVLAHIASTNDLILARLERMETTLIAEFHTSANWASPVEIRQRSHSAVLRAIDLEVEAVSDRVTKLEGSA